MEGWLWLSGFLVLGVLAFWLGGRQFRAGLAPRERALIDAMDQADRLRKKDPVAADQLFDQHMAERMQAFTMERDQLRELAQHDLSAAEQLRRALQEDLMADEAVHEEFSRKLLTDASVQATLIQIETSAARTRDELDRLVKHIDQLYTQM